MEQNLIQKIVFNHKENEYQINKQSLAINGNLNFLHQQQEKIVRHTNRKLRIAFNLKEDCKAHIKMNKFLRDYTNKSQNTWRSIKNMYKTQSHYKSIDWTFCWMDTKIRTKNTSFEFRQIRITLGFIYNLENYRRLLTQQRQILGWLKIQLQYFSYKISLNDSKLLKQLKCHTQHIFSSNKIILKWLNSIQYIVRISSILDLNHNLNFLQQLYQTIIFVLFYQLTEQIYYQVYNQHIEKLLFISYSKYQAQMTSIGNLIITLEVVKLKDQLEKKAQCQLQQIIIIQEFNWFNQIMFFWNSFKKEKFKNNEDLNIYKLTIQKKNHQTILVQWTSGNPLTLLFQNSHKLTLSDCVTNWDHCDNNSLLKFNTLNNNKCQIQCQIIAFSILLKIVLTFANLVYFKQQNALSNNINQELKVCLLESTHKYNQQDKQFNGGSLLFRIFEQIIILIARVIIK
ncbi:unnamed protein product [Paramecium sonneborni]|uniref:Transmembrane protein n=1 Tax=Paramecium sonneborni TaxID=65129 RepID=A0A8S1RND2_9CILI|nr:unnamed protein product [Paramecium sonneborni]